MGTFSSEEFETITTSIMDSMYKSAMKLGPAYPRSICAVGIIYAGEGRGALSSIYEQTEAETASQNERPRVGSDDYAEEILALTASKANEEQDKSPMTTKKKSAISGILTPSHRGNKKAELPTPASTSDMDKDPLKGSKHATPSLR